MGTFDKYLQLADKTYFNRLGKVTKIVGLTIESVGESVGFRSNSNFITAFRQVTGLTPSVYLKMAREERQHNTAPK